jgi:hypothetical protein
VGPFAPDPEDAERLAGAPAPELPRRYRVRRVESDSCLVADEAPRIQVRVHREHAFSESEARELGTRVILLDGAGSFGPLLDNKQLLYNLDHHSGCERTFTLATCEQALLLVTSGLELAEGDWSIYANEPDLDTVLALWCLLNHARLRDLSPESRDVLLPMIRLEGAIDANGTELAQMCGLPASAMRDAQRRLDHLLARERQVKGGGGWQTLDLEAYTVEMLCEIDRLIFTADDFRDYASIDEVYGHAEIGDRCVAVVCHDKAGIYAVEKLLKGRWGNQLGLIALENEPGHYTLRRTAVLADIDLEHTYDLLNLLDRNVDGRPPGKRWGGSDTIGGSPRPGGSALAPLELLRILGLAHRRPTPWQRALAVWRIGWLTAGVFAAAFLAGWGAAVLPELSAPLGSDAVRLGAFSLVVALASALLSRFYSGRRLWLFGFRRPAGGDWLPLALLAALAALPARAWFPAPTAPDLGALAAAAGTVALTALALELWFRGLVHGFLQLDSRVQSVGGRWRISGAAWVSAGLYALASAAVWLPRHGGAPVRLYTDLGVPELAVVAGTAVVSGLALAMMRERSLSVWPGVAAQLAGGLACAASWAWLAA